MKRLKILRISHCSTASAYRGRERALARLDDLDISLIRPTDWMQFGSNGEDVAEQFPCHLVSTIGTGSVPLFAFNPLPIIQIIKDVDPDVIDIHEEPYSVACFELMLLAKRYAPNAACVFYSAQNICKHYPFPFSFSERFVYRNSQGSYPCSTSVRDVLKRKGFTGPAPIIPLGLDPKDFNCSFKPLRQKTSSEFCIGYTGRLEHCKGAEYVIKAASQLRDLRLAAGVVKVLIAGSGSAEPVLRELTAQLGMGSDTVWLGELKMAEMAAFYRSCDVLVIPSLTTPSWREQFGRVAIEAMACETPVIVFDSGSLPEVVGDAGIVVQEKDLDGLVNALVELCDDGSAKQSRILLGRNMVMQKYTWESIALSMRDLYRDAITDKRREFRSTHQDAVMVASARSDGE